MKGYYVLFARIDATEIRPNHYMSDSNEGKRICGDVYLLRLNEIRCKPEALDGDVNLYNAVYEDVAEGLEKMEKGSLLEEVLKPQQWNVLAPKNIVRLGLSRWREKKKYDLEEEKRSKKQKKEGEKERLKSQKEGEEGFTAPKRRGRGRGKKTIRREQEREEKTKELRLAHDLRTRRVTPLGMQTTSAHQRPGLLNPPQLSAPDDPFNFLSYPQHGSTGNKPASSSDFVPGVPFEESQPIEGVESSVVHGIPTQQRSYDRQQGMKPFVRDTAASYAMPSSFVEWDLGVAPTRNLAPIGNLALMGDPTPTEDLLSIDDSPRDSGISESSFTGGGNDSGASVLGSESQDLLSGIAKDPVPIDDTPPDGGISEPSYTGAGNESATVAPRPESQHQLSDLAFQEQYNLPLWMETLPLEQNLTDELTAF